MHVTYKRLAALAGLVALPALGLAIAGPAATASPAYHATQIINGKHLHHTFGSGKTEPLSKADDLTALGGHLFVAFQNGVGSKGEPSPDGNTNSTLVEFTGSGHVVHQWDVKGKIDGLGNDPAIGLVIATVNEDGNSSLYTFTPAGGPATHYRYDRPLPDNGGTDAITYYHGQILISASAPGTTGKAAPQASYPAVFAVTLHAFKQTASVSGLFSDEATAVSATTGKSVKLGLTDPDSSEVVPSSAARFGGDFMLNSQGDLQLLFWSGRGAPLLVLNISQSIDDSAWATSRGGHLYVTSGDGVDVVSGPFMPGQFLVAVTPCNANSAPSTCTTPNYLGQLNPSNGQVSRLLFPGGSRG